MAGQCTLSSGERVRNVPFWRGDGEEGFDALFEVVSSGDHGCLGAVGDAGTRPSSGCGLMLSASLRRWWSTSKSGSPGEIWRTVGIPRDPAPVLDGIWTLPPSPMLLRSGRWAT
jgi:hypothetical protein